MIGHPTHGTIISPSSPGHSILRLGGQAAHFVEANEAEEEQGRRVDHTIAGSSVPVTRKGGR